MPTSVLSAEFQRVATAFLWDQWSQLGVQTNPALHDRWAADPEALILTSLEFGRDEPRLFDEVLDWMLVNERLVSVQRLRNLAHGDEDRALADAAVGWVAHHGPRSTSQMRPAPPAVPKPLFRNSGGIPVGKSDEAFLQAGLLRARTEPRRHSQPPDLVQPIAFALRLRQLLGIGVRAEVVRVMLGSTSHRHSAQALAMSTGYAKRNVHGALIALQSVRAITGWSVANEFGYAVDQSRWAAFLQLAPDALPQHRDWPQLFDALRRVNRWFHDPAREAQTDYMRASAARELMRDVSRLLRYAGVPADDRGSGANYWESFEGTVRLALRSLTSERRTPLRR